MAWKFNALSPCNALSPWNQCPGHKARKLYGPIPHWQILKQHRFEPCTVNTTILQMEEKVLPIGRTFPSIGEIVKVTVHGLNLCCLCKPTIYQVEWTDKIQNSILHQENHWININWMGKFEKSSLWYRRNKIKCFRMFVCRNAHQDSRRLFCGCVGLWKEDMLFDSDHWSNYRCISFRNISKCAN